MEKLTKYSASNIDRNVIADMTIYLHGPHAVYLAADVDARLANVDALVTAAVEMLNADCVRDAFGPGIAPDCECRYCSLIRALKPFEDSDIAGGGK
jgi:hypothetical protein